MMRRSRARKLRLAEVEVRSPRIPPGLDGIRIGHLSDIHVRTGVRPRRLELAVAMLNELRPDFVALTGDYLCLSVRPLPMLTEALAQLRIPAYATLGNHDHWGGARAVRRALEAASVDVLVNAHRILHFASGRLALVGIDDSVTRHHDPVKAFRGVPEDVPRVVLSHDPKSADFLHRYGPALVLSGHTHGGQVFLPRLTPILAERVGMKYLAGLFDVGGAALYVNRGLGAGIPVRFQAPVEVASLCLRAGSARAHVA